MAWLPLPGGFGEGLQQGAQTGQSLFHHLLENKAKQMHYGLAEQKLPHEIAALKARARQSEMIANLLGGVSSQGSMEIQGEPGMEQFPGQIPQTNVYGRENGVEVINQGDPRFSQFNNNPAAAAMLGLAPTRTEINNGYLYKYHPNGEVTRQKVGHTPEEQAQLQTRTNEEQHENKLTTDERVLLEKEIPVAENALNEAKRIRKMMESLTPEQKEKWFEAPLPFVKPEEVMKWRQRQIKDKEFGQLQAAFGRFQGLMANELSNRGLATAFSLARESKPGFMEKYPSSLGKMDEFITSLENEVKLDKDRLGVVSKKGDKNRAPEQELSGQFKTVQLENGRTAQVPIEKLDGFMMKYANDKPRLLD